MKKNVSILCLSILCFSIVSCKQNNEIASQPVKVKVMNIEPTSATVGQSYSGTVEEDKNASLSFPVTGTLNQIYVSEGQTIKKGEIIASIDDTMLRNSYEIAKSTLEQVEDAYQRQKQLFENNSLPEIQWIEIQSKLRQARAAEQIARKNLSESKLYAPFSGVVLKKEAEIGQTVTPGVSVVKIITISSSKVSIFIPENEISQVQIGMPVEVCVAALGNKHYTGTIVERVPSANSLSRSYEVKAKLDNLKGELLPGMICTLKIKSQEKPNVIILPNNVIQIDNQNRKFVWVNKNGTASKRYVEVGHFTNNGVEVTSGLKENEEVIIEGQQKVSENMAITIK